MALDVGNTPHVLALGPGASDRLMIDANLLANLAVGFLGLAGNDLDEMVLPLLGGEVPATEVERKGNLIGVGVVQVTVTDVPPRNLARAVPRFKPQPSMLIDVEQFGQFRSIKTVAPVKQEFALVVLVWRRPDHDRRDHAALLDALAERLQFVGRHHREFVGRRVHLKNFAPRLAHHRLPSRRRRTTTTRVALCRTQRDLGRRAANTACDFRRFG
jgi:hypothetical protein